MVLTDRLADAWRALLGARAFEAAQYTPQHMGRPLSANLSPDGELEAAGTNLRQWGRSLDENHDISIGVLDDLVTNIVGTEIVIEPLPRVGNAVSQRLADTILEEWSQWAKAPEVTGEIPWGEYQRIACRSWLRDGECFHQHVRAGAPYEFGDSVRYRLEYLEADMCPFNELLRENPNYRYGVYLNAWNQPLAYDIYLRPPEDPMDLLKGRGTFASPSDVKQVPAENLIHLKFVRRWPQTRGQPIIHGIIKRLADLKNYEESERIAARVGASMCAFIRKGPDQDVQDLEDNVSGERQIQFQAGKIFDNLLPGEEVSTINANRPNPELSNFRNAMIRAIAAGTGTRYSAIAKDYSGTYASQRQEMVEARPHYLRLRNYFVAKLIRPVYETWLRQAWLEGRFGVGLDRIQFGDLARAEYIGPGQPWIDPKKEVDADVTAIDAGLVSRTQVIRGRGGDPRAVDEAIAADTFEKQAPPSNLSLVEETTDEDETTASA